jgi:glutamate synthase domain-containing protein 2
MTNLKKYKLKTIDTVKKIEFAESTNMVYDLTVEDNHSYCVNNHIVHNCTTTMHTAVGYPMASLIKECYEMSTRLSTPAKIVADGGMKTYSDIIKALALGADYVMVGSLFNKAIDSCGDNYLWNKIKVNKKIAKWAYDFGIPVYKKFRGMSTKEVQKKWGRKELVTSEGVVRKRKVEYTLAKWVDNFESYLRSAMSYTNSSNLQLFIGHVEIIQITDNAYNRFKK